MTLLGKSPHLLVLVNPISGGGHGKRLAPSLPDIFKHYGQTAQVVLLSGTGSALETISTCTSEYGGIVAVGGDGTVNEVATAVYRTCPEKPIGIIPLGLSNCLARHLGLPRQVESAVKIIARGQQQALNLAFFDQRLAVAFVGAGLDAAIVHRVCQDRKGPINNWVYIRAGLITWRQNAWPDIKVAVDGRAISGRYYLAILSAITNYAAYFRLTPGPHYRLYLFRGRGPASVLRSATRLGVYRDLARAADLVIPVTEGLTCSSETKAAFFQYDGEYGGPLPVHCRVVKSALNFFAAPS